MTRIVPDTDIEAEDSDFKPLTAQEAQQWRRRNPVQSPWRVILLQAFVGALTAVIVGAVAERNAGWSAAYGALAVVVPSVLFVRGLARQRGVTNAGAAAAGFFIWEMVKIGLTVALVAAAPRLVPGLSWLALVLGMVVTIKTYWVGLLFLSGVLKPSRKDKS